MRKVPEFGVEQFVIEASWALGEVERNSFQLVQGAVVGVAEAAPGVKRIEQFEQFLVGGAVQLAVQYGTSAWVLHSTKGSV